MAVFHRVAGRGFGLLTGSIEHVLAVLTRVGSLGEAGTMRRKTSNRPASDEGSPAGAVQPVSKAVVEEIFTRLRAADPAPKSELHSLNTFTFLVAVVLSAQATDAGVNKATPALFALADSPAAMVALGEEKVRDLVKTIGFYRTKAKNVVALSRRLVEAFDGQVPDTREDLESLPGVGRKTANVVLNSMSGQPTIGVDTHVFRVSNRIPLAPGATPLAVEVGLERVVPDHFKGYAHHWLLLHGRYTCRAKSPACSQCLVADCCRWPGKEQRINQKV